MGSYRHITKSIFIFLALSLKLFSADILLTKEGARLIGKVDRVEDGILYLETDYAGTIPVKLNKIDLAEIETELIWKLKDEQEVQGVVQIKPGSRGWILVTNSHDRSISANMVVRAWANEGQNTEIVTEKSIRKMINIREPRKWSFEGGVNLSGKSGNTSRFSTAVNLDFIIEGDHDRLDLYGSYEYANSNDVRSTNEVIGGISYTNYFFDKLGWFAREELESDDFENIKIRSTTAGGLSYRVIRTEKLYFGARAGISYRYENYILLTNNSSQEDASTESYPGLDFGLEANWKFSDWGRFKSEVNFLPSFNSGNNYIIEQDSGLYFPLAYSDKWKLRVGLSNQYNSVPDSGRDKLDTSYYLRLIYSIN